MKYLKKFYNHASYEDNKQNLILPNVSLCAQENEVHYNPYFDPYKGHEYVEIGGLKWATMNVGANSVTDYGLYFQWGDTQGYTADQVGTEEGKKAFTWEDYKWAEDGGTTFTKYNKTDGKTVLEASDDAAVANWGGSWRTPTTEEYAALGNAVNTAWTADYQGSGVAGILCTDKTDSSKTLFFPAAGLCDFGDVINVGGGGNYWTSTPSNGLQQSAYNMDFSDNGTDWVYDNFRCIGFSVRGVVG